MSAVASTVTADQIEADPTLYKRIAWKIIPFLFISYVVAYLDRVNVGFAALRMQEDLSFSAAVYGFGAGIFFFGYVLFEVPSNLLLHRIGARATIMRIMIGWGLVSSAMMFMQTPMQFYIGRFLLGAFEAGFFPGVILYLTYWFPSRLRGGFIAIFMSAIALAGIVGGPVSGWIMGHMDGVNGWHGWQWMLLLEGMPAVILGVLAGFLLTDKPEKAKWLSDAERQQIARDIEDSGAASHGHTMKDVVSDPRVFGLGAVYFAIAAGVYVLSFWLPGLVKDYGVTDPFHIGLLTAIPFIAAAIGMVVISRHSDARRERRWHTAACMLLGAGGLVASTFSGGSLVIGLTALTVAATGIFATMPVFWTIPTRYLSGSAAAGGIALINSIGLIGGFVSPTVLGWVKATTNSLNLGLYFFAVVLCAGAVLLLVVIPERLLKEH